ncbi:CRISPR-associated protein [Dehalococcoides mccartyi]|uniref:CRISPR-associated protein n=1 Tax=Dehalococcoides mccartyi TaxID=61435 RepID=A0A0V8M5D5_9CHLR|nr:CRISPR-associated helicase/endonuclease Cas3 [Dehalococcoides mccartyi]KSV18986.1 CRISPR-associated protein [Dehalococcoides mccartyi]
MTDYIARINPVTGQKQSVEDHLLAVAALCQNFSSKIQLGNCGNIVGLLHDLGKCSQEFQGYIGEVTQVGGSTFKNRVLKPDHSSAGGQYIWNTLSGDDYSLTGVAQALALTACSHHSGLPDCIAIDGTDCFGRRMLKEEFRTHLSEVSAKIAESVYKKLEKHFSNRLFQQEFTKLVTVIKYQKESQFASYLQLGLALRFLLSALIDADRMDAAGRNVRPGEDWQAQTECLEQYLKQFQPDSQLNKLRQDISEACFRQSKLPPGLYRLSVPTGGGKTLSSLRFGLNHAKINNLERIFYIAPFTTILDQNAEVIRKALDVPPDSPFVLEHHSNILEEKQTSLNEQLAENWEAPVVLTTSVQFLETFYSHKTGCNRRLHNMANSVIIFDEVQALPEEMMFFFNNAVNFLTRICSSTVLLCTATQPPLDKLDKDKGVLCFAPDAELAPDAWGNYTALNARVKLENRSKIAGYNLEELKDIVLEQARQGKKILVVVNTKAQAKALYISVKAAIPNVYHLSTSMCPYHRKQVLTKLKYQLESNESLSRPLVCISTQLIEAGVDIDFEVVIRYLAGLDSITQSAGRCNRNFKDKQGLVILVNPGDENLDHLKEIQHGKTVTQRLISEIEQARDSNLNQLLSPGKLSRFFDYYYFQQRGVMECKKTIDGIEESVLNLFSNTHNGVKAYKSSNKPVPGYCFYQAFRTGGENFRVIDSPTKGVITACNPDAESIINKLCSLGDMVQLGGLLRKSQQYAVNLFEYEFEKLAELGALHETQPESGVFYLERSYYDSEIGISTEPEAQTFKFC